MKFFFIVQCTLFSIVSSFVFYTNIETGYVGVEYYQREIQPTLRRPGKNWYTFLSEIEHVEIRPQSDVVKNVICMTNEGLGLSFDTIEVGNQLTEDSVLSTVSRFGPQYDKYLVTDLVRHQVNVICSKKSAHQLAIEQFDELDDLLKNFIQEENDRQNTGLIINFVRLTKPKLPPSIEKNYLALAEEKTMKKVVEERTHRIRTEKESEMIVAQKDNEIKVANAQKTNEVMIMNMRSKREEQQINNQMIIESAQANAEKIKLEADALQAMYRIEGYTDVEIAKSIASNQKIYYGEKIPSLMYTNVGLQ
jgi:hypothetical protein